MLAANKNANLMLHKGGALGLQGGKKKKVPFVFCFPVTQPDSASVLLLSNTKVHCVSLRIVRLRTSVTPACTSVFLSLAVFRC